MASQAPPLATTAPIDIANSSRRSTSPVRSGLKPYVREELDLSATVSRLLASPSVASHFIPKMIYDVAFISLRHMVFKVDSKSATPIAHILHESVLAKGGGSGEMYGLIDDLCPPGGHKTKWFERSEEVKLRWPKYAQFRKMIDEARKTHAVRLRDAGMVDVDVSFVGFESGIAIYKRDQEIIEKQGGKIYHLWPLNQVKRTSRMSALMKAETLDELYPAKRLEGGCVTIMVNTQPAEAPAPSDPQLTGGLFLYSQPLFGARGIVNFSASSPEERKAIIDNEIEEIIARNLSNKDKCDDILQPTQAIPHRSWNVGTLKVDEPLFRWSIEDEPLSYLIHSENDSWWKRDLSIRTAMLKNWHDTTWTETGELDQDGKAKGEHVISEKPPHEAKANVDFDILPGLCDIYPANRNYEYYERAIAPLEAKEGKEELRKAEQRYQYCHYRTKKHEAYMERMATESTNPANHQNPGFQKMLKNAIGSQFLFDLQLRHSVASVMQLRQEDGIDRRLVSKDLDIDAAESRWDRPPIQLRHYLHHNQKYSQHGRARRTSKLAKPTLATLAEGQTFQESRMGKNLQVEAFLEYDEPILTRSADKEGRGEGEQSEYEVKLLSKQHRLRPFESRRKVEALKQEAATRKANKTSIADILADTGIVRYPGRHKMLPVQRSSSTASVETAVRIRLPSPVTPIDSPKTCHRACNARKDEHAHAGGNAKPAIVGEEDAEAVE